MCLYLVDNSMNLNKVFVLGNLTRDPETRSLPSGQPVVSFSIATNRFFTSSQGEKKTDVEFHNIVAFGKLADTISRYLKKGSMALIEGRLKTRNWQDSAGVKHYKTEIIAEGLQLGPKQSGTSSNYENQDQSNKPTTNSEIKPEEIPVIEENYTAPASADEIDIKDIPF